MYGLGTTEIVLFILLVIAALIIVATLLLRFIFAGGSKGSGHNKVITPESGLLRACSKCGNVTNAYNSFCPTCGKSLG